MKQENGVNPVRKGLHRYFHISRWDGYLCAFIAIVFGVFGAIELFKIEKLTFIRMSNSFQFALLFALFGLVASMYYKLFEEQYDKKK